jgi:epoxide hydrolase-like predicted phosphatase
MTRDVTAPDVEAVVFDVGGVLCPSPTDEFSKVDREYGLPAGTVQSFLRGGSLFARCETGQLPLADFFEQVHAEISATHRVSVPAGRLDAMMEAIMGDQVRPDMIALLAEVKAAGHRTALLTNIFAERREWLHATFPADLVDVYADSSELGLRKPDPAIYLRLLELLDLPAHQLVFVDDFAENLVPAKEFGMHTVQFHDPAQARAALVAAGVRIPREAAPRKVRP